MVIYETNKGYHEKDYNELPYTLPIVNTKTFCRYFNCNLPNMIVGGNNTTFRIICLMDIQFEIISYYTLNLGY